jgi:hypothetical protein
MIDPNNTSGNNTSGGTKPSSGGSFWENLSLEGIGSLIGAIAGGTGLLSGGSQQKTGYQGQIPNLTAVRDQIPYGQVESEGRRPGGAGRRYFTDTVYAKSDPGAGLPSLAQAQQQVADQREAILTKQPYRAPSYVGYTPPPQRSFESALEDYWTQNPDILAEVIRAYPAAFGLPVQGYAQGGIASLPQTKGYYLGGATDGMADKIPANIDGKQPAALSDGEFVVPADVVSHLGNGNSNSGARQLYQMMERIRKARTGNAKQGKQINPKNMLPG